MRLWVHIDQRMILQRERMPEIDSRRCLDTAFLIDSGDSAHAAPVTRQPGLAGRNSAGSKSLSG